MLLPPESVNERAHWLNGIHTTPVRSWQSPPCWLDASCLPFLFWFQFPLGSKEKRDQPGLCPGPKCRMREEALSLSPSSHPAMELHLTHFRCLCWFFYRGKFGAGHWDLVKLVIHFGPKGTKAQVFPRSPLHGE